MNPPPQKKNAHLLTIAVDIDRPEPVSQGDVRGFIFFAQHKPDKVLVAPVFNKRKEVEKKTSERMFFFSSSKGEKKKRLKKNSKKTLSHPPVDPARKRPGSLRKDPVDDPVGQAVVAVAEEVLFRQQEVVVGIELLFFFFLSFEQLEKKKERKKKFKKAKR